MSFNILYLIYLDYIEVLTGDILFIKKELHDTSVSLTKKKLHNIAKMLNSLTFIPKINITSTVDQSL